MYLRETCEERDRGRRANLSREAADTHQSTGHWYTNLNAAASLPFIHSPIFLTSSNWLPAKSVGYFLREIAFIHFQLRKHSNNDINGKLDFLFTIFCLCLLNTTIQDIPII